MKTKNIFYNSESYVSLFVISVYNHLMTRQFVSYADILASFHHKDVSYYDTHTLGKEDQYADLKKAFPIVLNELQSKIPGCIVNNGKKKGVAYKYVGKDDDPLSDDKKYYKQKTLEEYVKFCKDSIGMLPPVWFSSFFDETVFLGDAKKEIESGSIHIGSGMEQNLKNIDLLPVFNNSIESHKSVNFVYRPYEKEPYSITLHPHYLKEYNGRWFILGRIDGSSSVDILAIDRIQGKVTENENVEYVPAEKGFYQKYFKNIIGVTHETGAVLEHIIIRTHSKYQHGLLLTKPIHNSQQEIAPFEDHEGKQYGEISIDVEPNRELLGKILAFGQYLEIVSPISLRNRICEILSEQSEHYGLNTK